MSKNYSSETGSIRPDIRTELISSISIAKGVLATLSLEHPSAWMGKYHSIHPEHLRILLKEILEEVQALETFMEMIPAGLPPQKPVLKLV